MNADRETRTLVDFIIQRILPTYRMTITPETVDADAANAAAARVEKALRECAEEAEPDPVQEFLVGSIAS